MDCGLCWVYRLARDGNMTTSTRSNLSHGCSEPPCLIRAVWESWTRLSNYHSKFVNYTGNQRWSGKSLIHNVLITYNLHYESLSSSISQPCLRTFGIYGGSICRKTIRSMIFRAINLHSQCVSLINSDLFLEFFLLIDDFPRKNLHVGWRWRYKATKITGSLGGGRPFLCLPRPPRTLETIRSNLHCILDHSAGERKLARKTATRTWWAIEGRFWTCWLNINMDGIWVICCMDTISMTIVKLVALQGLIVLKAGCAKHGWEVHGLPHVVSDFGVSWQLAHLIETMLR